MASGIYRLTFLTGDTYIGKSVDLEQRWQQHAIKLEKGTAARQMLTAFFESGYTLPKAEVLLYCHPDLLDEYEGMYINLWRPELNTSIPPRREDWEYEQLEKYTKTISQAQTVGVPALISTAFNLEEEVEDLKLSRARAVRELGELQDNWNDQEFKEISKEEAYGRIQDEAWARVEIAKSELRAYKERIERASWWARLWKTW